jgi:hypothetical protein
MRKFAVAFAVASVVGAVAGGTEIALHGTPFFMFRANGAGASEIGTKEPANPPKAGQPLLSGDSHTAATPHVGKHRK